jgi:hypothetical protein
MSVHYCETHGLTKILCCSFRCYLYFSGDCSRNKLRSWLITQTKSNAHFQSNMKSCVNNSIACSSCDRDVWNFKPQQLLFDH